MARPAIRLRNGATKLTLSAMVKVSYSIILVFLKVDLLLLVVGEICLPESIQRQKVIRWCSLPLKQGEHFLQSGTSLYSGKGSLHNCQKAFLRHPRRLWHHWCPSIDWRPRSIATTTS